MVLKRIVSGGQTGVDRAALDAALEAGFPCGGWCPAGRRAEDGRIPERYPLQEMPQGGYLARTARNVRDSDGTLILTFGLPTGGTARTVQFCEQYGRPVCVVDGLVTGVDEAVQQAAAFVAEHGIQILNVAGPRGSGEPRGYGFALAVVDGLIGLARGGRSAGFGQRTHVMSDVGIAVAEVLAKAADVLGSPSSAESWMNTPAVALNGERPSTLLATSDGRELVYQLLVRIERGVYT